MTPNSNVIVSIAKQFIGFMIGFKYAFIMGLFMVLVVLNDIKEKIFIKKVSPLFYYRINQGVSLKTHQESKLTSLKTRLTFLSSSPILLLKSANKLKDFIYG